MSYIGRSSKLFQRAYTKVSFLATAGQTSKTGLSYTPTFVEVYVNGVLLTDTTDFTATNGNSVTFTVALLLNDEVTVVSLKTFTVADHYNKTEADTLLATKAPIASPVFTGNVGIGTSSPSGLLHLQSSAPAMYITDTTNNTDVAISSNNSGDLIFNADLNNVAASTNMQFKLDGSEAMRIDSSGNVLVGKNTSNQNTAGHEIRHDGAAWHTRDSNFALLLNRTTTDGEIVRIRKDGTTVGSIGASTDKVYIGTSTNGLAFDQSANIILPWNSSTLSARDNAIDLGYASGRFDDIYATNGTIQTSDRTLKQDILAITTAESNVAIACKGLLRSFRWKDAVAEKGDDARIHFGIIAQDLQDAFTAEGLDAGRYAMFISSTWWETQTEVPAVEAEDAIYEDVVVTPAQEAGFREVTPAVQAEPAYYDVDGNVIKPAVEASEAVHEATEAVAEVTESRIATEAVEAKDAYTRTDAFDTLAEAPEDATERTRLGVRYPELLSFIIAAL